jgi:aldehyde:ferredoxin oxidoreductase
MKGYPEPVSKIAKRLDMTENELAPVLMDMSKRGLLFRSSKNGPRYMIVPLAEGMYEFQVNSINKKDIAILHEYIDFYMENSWYSTKTTQHRIIPISKSISADMEIYSYWSMGAMIGNDDLDTIARPDFLCDDIGLDTMNTGVAVAVAMDAGYKSFGDGDAAIRMVEEVTEGTELGIAVGNGPVAVGKHFNHDRVPVVKGQSIAAYDPRAIQGMAVTYSTSPMGGDHTAGWVVDQNLEAFGGTIDALGAEGQVEASRDTQIHMAAVDSVGICDFAQSGLATPEGIDNVYRMIAAKSGQPFSESDWTELGVRVLKAERQFNRNAGFTQKDDRLPDMFYTEPLEPHNIVVKVTPEAMDTTFEF